MADELRKFEQEKQALIGEMSCDTVLRQESIAWITKSSRYKYSYNFTWLGRPIIQLPQDMLAMQEIIWRVKPDLIIETGIAHGGSLIFHASMLELTGGDGLVLGIDVEIRKHNRIEIEKHPLFKRITMIEGSSIDGKVVNSVHELAKTKERVLVVLDSNHTRSHVLKELELYSLLVKRGSYIVVLDTIIEDMPGDFFPDRPWGKGNNPKTAVREFLTQNRRFQVDAEMEDKLLITMAPGGYLKCVSD